MGIPLEVLAEKSIKSESKHYPEFYAVEIAEDFHIHWRNTRLQFDIPEFLLFAAVVKEAVGTWERMGKPDPRPEWTLPKYLGGPVKVDPIHKINTNRLQLELMKQDDYIHFHCKSTRLDLSIDEFLEVADVFEKAKKRIMELKNK